MLTPALVSLLIGLVLAQRFKVLSLIPVILLTLLFALTAANAAWTSALIAAVAIAGLQVGYLLGIGLRQLMLVARAHRLRTVSRLSPSQWRARYRAR